MGSDFGRAREPLSQRFALEILHDEILDLLVVCHALRSPGQSLVSHVVQGADVRVIERADLPRFPLEALTQHGISGDVGREQLDRHSPLESGIGGSIDLAHSADANQRLDTIGTELDANVQGHRSSKRAHCRGTTAATAERE
jgi:hypothetical protein